MLKPLQKNKGPNGGSTETLWSTELILDNDYTKKAISFINDAQAEIRIMAYAWRWYDSTPEDTIQQFNIALIRAIQRGVRVRALCERVQEGVILKMNGITTRGMKTHRTLHTKAILIDEKTLIVGSHNFTRRAHLDNFEASLATQDFEPCVQFLSYFDTMWESNGKDII